VPHGKLVCFGGERILGAKILVHIILVHEDGVRHHGFDGIVMNIFLEALGIILDVCNGVWLKHLPVELVSNSPAAVENVSVARRELSDLDVHFNSRRCAALVQRDFDEARDVAGPVTTIDVLHLECRPSPCEVQRSMLTSSESREFDLADAVSEARKVVRELLGLSVDLGAFSTLVIWTAGADLTLQSLVS